MERETLMPEPAPKPSPDEARAALASIEQTASDSCARAIYPRWLAAGMALWGGTLVTLGGMDSPWVVPLLFAGFIVYWLWRRAHGAAMREIHSRGGLVRVAVATLALVAIAIGGIVGRAQYGLAWAPYGAGAVIAAGLFAIMEICYAPLRARLASRRA
jgi:hypothetical protein